MGAVVGFIFYVFIVAVGLPDFARFELGLAEIVLLGVGLGLVFIWSASYSGTGGEDDHGRPPRQVG